MNKLCELKTPEIAQDGAFPHAVLGKGVGRTAPSALGTMRSRLTL